MCASAFSDLRSVLSQAGDPWACRGCGTGKTVLVLAVGAVLAGARSFVAVVKWAADTDPDTRAAAGLGRCGPSESTFRRVLQALDADAFDALLGGWVEQRIQP